MNYKELFTSNEERIIVSEEDYEVLKDRKIKKDSHGGFRVTLDGKTEAIHRYIIRERLGINIETTDNIIHKNGDKSDNTRDNLEKLTKKQDVDRKWDNMIKELPKNEIRGNKLIIEYSAYGYSNTEKLETPIEVEFDEDDRDKIQKYYWAQHNEQGYIFTRHESSQYIELAKLLLDITDKPYPVEYLDGNQLNNKKENLKIDIQKKWKYNILDNKCIVQTENDEVVLFDAEDEHKIKDLWLISVNKSNYAFAKDINNNPINLARYILDYTGNDKVVDHINNNRSDNRKKNLRIVTSQQNGVNKQLRTPEDTYRGVYNRENNETYTSSITIKGQTFYLGSSKEPWVLGMRRDMLNLKYNGKVSKLNFDKEIVEYLLNYDPLEEQIIVDDDEEVTEELNKKLLDKQKKQIEKSPKKTYNNEYKNVSKKGNNWRASFQYKNKNYSIPSCDTALEAAERIDKKMIDVMGDDLKEEKLNFPKEYTMEKFKDEIVVVESTKEYKARFLRERLRYKEGNVITMEEITNAYNKPIGSKNKTLKTELNKLGYKVEQRKYCPDCKTIKGDGKINKTDMKALCCTHDNAVGKICVINIELLE